MFHEGIWSWILDNQNTITFFIVFGGAIVGGVTWILQQRQKPSMEIRTINTTIDNQVPRLSFAWNIRNKGHSAANGLSIGIRIGAANYSSLVVVGESLQPTHDRKIWFELVETTNPPQFALGGRRHPLELPATWLASPPRLSLEWNRNYQVELYYYCDGSGMKTNRFNLQLGSPDNISIQLSDP